MTGRSARWRAGLLAGLAAAAVSACAPRGAVFTPPAAGGLAAPDAAAVVAAVQRRCAAIDTLTAQAALSGRLAGQRVRGRLDLGLTADGHVRLEAIAPFGLLFVLAGERDRATLLLAREGRVLRDQPAAAIVDALAGIHLAPETLLAIIVGCPAEDAAVTGGRGFPDGLLEASAGADRTVWLRRTGDGARLVAARLGDLTIEYPAAVAGDAPRTIRFRRAAGDGRAASDLSLALSQIETGRPLPPAAFAVTVPADAQPLTLAQLRESGLLSGR